MDSFLLSPTLLGGGVGDKPPVAVGNYSKKIPEAFEPWSRAHQIVLMNVNAFHSREWSMSNFSCSLTRNITSHSKENLAFHSLLRWKMIIIQILATSLIQSLFERLGEYTFWAQEWKGECLCQSDWLFNPFTPKGDQFQFSHIEDTKRTELVLVQWSRPGKDGHWARIVAKVRSVPLCACRGKDASGRVDCGSVAWICLLGTVGVTFPVLVNSGKVEYRYFVTPFRSIDTLLSLLMTTMNYPCAWRTRIIHLHHHHHHHLFDFCNLMIWH